MPNILPLALLAAALAQPVRPYRPAVDVIDYAFALTLPDTGRSLDGEATIRFARTASADTLVLDLIGLRVARAQVDGRAATFRQDSATVRIALPRHGGTNTGDTLTAIVRYAGTPSDGLI